MSQTRPVSTIDSGCSGRKPNTLSLKERDVISQGFVPLDVGKGREWGTFLVARGKGDGIDVVEDTPGEGFGVLLCETVF